MFLECIRGDITEAKILAAANSFLPLGLKDLGYEYDDCRSLISHVNGRIAPDTTKFPSGISGVTTQVHILCLKLSIYSDAGTNTCSGYLGSLN
ncbi:hypothetical protein L873DRAFT_1314728 [Choiromyces venosus 120613-1]|uniref:alpha-galactosidase n=1 Tax=Choiromyces venosus 120613-1 TaxID=1336337 RepID=A0A3N4JNP5_9PEZI|nr:hypothetical protein L873DRAFT_1314728 [Choiromyces venosus 120613-1]